MALHEAGRLAEAERIYREILGRAPAHFDALHLLGVIQYQKEEYESAVELIGQAIGIDPRQAVLHSNMGLALHRLKRPEDALACYERALAIEPDNAQALNNHGMALRDLKRPEEALASCDRALALNPDFAEALNNRGTALRDLRRLDEALVSYERALALRPDMAEAHNNRADTLQKLMRPAEALASCDRALELKPDYPAALNNMGNALQDLNLPEEALASYDRALKLWPDFAEALNNRGNALQELGRNDEALASFSRALSLEPGYAAANWNESLCRLRAGDFERGWPGYEWRWQDVQRNSRRNFKQPLWLGEESIAGKTILLHAEQGLGDTIQFCRYSKLVAERGATVLLEVQSPLKPLLTGLNGVDRLLAKGEPLPEFDCHCPLLSLPLACGTRLDNIPAAIPYLGCDPSRVNEWRNRLGVQTLPRVGLTWAGRPGHKNDHNRSIPLVEFEKLLSGRAQFVSLQKELRPADRAALEARRDILHFGDELKDFADTAALVELMDVVVSVDTSVAHLAGAMGKRVWLLLPFAPDWRWLLQRDDSPWYPTATLLRQPTIGDWASVIERARSIPFPAQAGKSSGLSRLSRAIAGWIRGE
ncbi:MAG TPA: tetratricopeptide repeat protein [Burkholderiales bacterium]|nr:tetratricopeptide repeat protein [Burkholderiales bacterium]